MKKITVFSFLAITVVVFSYCSSSKKTASKAKAKSVYTANIETIMQSYCGPCHFPPGGNKKPLNTYASVRDNIDDIIRRVELNPTDRGFMPFKKTARLDQATIDAIKQWKADGMLEK